MFKRVWRKFYKETIYLFFPPILLFFLHTFSSPEKQIPIWSSILIGIIFLLIMMSKSYFTVKKEIREEQNQNTSVLEISYEKKSISSQVWLDYYENGFYILLGGISVCIIAYVTTIEPEKTNRSLFLLFIPFFILFDILHILYLYIKISRQEKKKEKDNSKSQS